jgi:uncharacterized protein YjiS (DUF1127 family)
MRSEHCIGTIQPPRVGALTRFRLGHLRRRLARGLDWALLCCERVGQRRQLAELNDHMLRDIGLSRADVMAEATKPFWRP